MSLLLIVMLAENIVICRESREQFEEKLERWSYALEKRGIKASWDETETYVNKREKGGKVNITSINSEARWFF